MFKTREAMLEQHRQLDFDPIRREEDMKRVQRWVD
jgi:hypothetical protein